MDNPSPDPQDPLVAEGGTTTTTTTKTMTTCLYCGDDEHLEVAEFYPAERTLLLDGCCEHRILEAHAALEAAGCDRSRSSRRAAVAWLRDELGIDARQLIADEGLGLHYGNAGLTIDPGLQHGPVRQRDAKALCREHHRHNRDDEGHRPPAGWRWGHGLYSGDELIAVAMVGRPVSPAFDKDTTVEVTRVCVAGHAGLLGWNACSMLYAAAAKEAARRGFPRVITYTHKAEAGSSLRGAGWHPRAESAGGVWHRANRPRKDAGRAKIAKIRWEAA